MLPSSHKIPMLVEQESSCHLDQRRYHSIKLLCVDKDSTTFGLIEINHGDFS